ncbi:ankyrin repeat and SOCS box protein 8-like [Liolophura sinensis]|uniref:ankyrin repeat and SOCS box protein 8-like n=1 Tax=Liolophura sinensis TaxID=3198878 RepID=UPI0031592591
MTFSCVDFVRQMVQLATSVNAQNKDGWTPLHYAARKKNVDVVRFLLEKGALVNVLDEGLKTPLHYAVMKNSADVVRLLLEKGADVNVQDKPYIAPDHRKGNISTPFQMFNFGPVQQLGTSATLNSKTRPFISLRQLHSP